MPTKQKQQSQVSFTKTETEQPPKKKSVEIGKVVSLIKLQTTAIDKFSNECDHLHTENNKLKRQMEEVKAGKPVGELESEELADLIDLTCTNIQRSFDRSSKRSGHRLGTG